MPDSSSNTDFGPLEKMEFEGVHDLFAHCEFIRKIASTSGLIVVQWASDVEAALATIPIMTANNGIMGDSPRRRARRVARQAFRAAEGLRVTSQAAAKLPQVYLKTYADVIQARRSRSRKSFDPTQGL